MLKLLLTTAVLAWTAAPGSAQTLIGSTVTAAGYYPTATTIQTNIASATIGAGVEFADGSIVYFAGGTPGATFDFRTTSLELVNLETGGGGSTSQFDGIIFRFFSAPSVVGVSFDASSQFTFPGITFSPDSISLNFAGIAHPAIGARALINIQLAPVPEPAPWLLLSAGVLLIVATKAKYLTVTNATHVPRAQFACRRRRTVQGLTPRSSGAPTAAHQARSVVQEHSPQPGPGVLPSAPA